MKLIPLILLPALLVPPPVHGYDRTGARVPVHVVMPHDARFQALIDAAVREGLPGVSLRVKAPGIDYKGVAGVADLATGEPFTTDHVMYVASLGKTFTAAVALQLCEEGRLELDAPITTWLPLDVTGHIPFSGKITLRHLLSHTSGLVDYLNDDRAWQADFYREPHRQWTNSEVVPYVFDRPLLFEPGTGFHYSNSNYILAGWIIERVTRQPLHALIRERILAPLGLKHTFSGDETIGSEARVHGYIRRRGRIFDTYRWYSHFGLADSGMHSTADDLALFLKSLLTTDDILSERMRTEMTKVSASGHPTHPYGIGLFVQRDPLGPGLWYANNGVDPGYHADMMYFPDHDLTVVLCANASQEMADLIYERLITAVVQLANETARAIRLTVP
jgi:D-alanyl-D-alanine carboxypeptidase